MNRYAAILVLLSGLILGSLSASRVEATFNPCAYLPKLCKPSVTPTETVSPTPTEEVTPTVTEAPTATPTATVTTGGPGDGLSDGKSDGKSSCPECTAPPVVVPQAAPATGFGPK